MKINIDNSNKSIILPHSGDIAYFDNDYWLIGEDSYYYLESLTRLDSYPKCDYDSWISYLTLCAFLQDKNAIIYDGKKSTLNLVPKESEDNKNDPQQIK